MDLQESAPEESPDQEIAELSVVSTQSVIFYQALTIAAKLGKTSLTDLTNFLFSTHTGFLL